MSTRVIIQLVLVSLGIGSLVGFIVAAIIFSLGWPSK